jgi:hypothetical protein
MQFNGHSEIGESQIRQTYLAGTVPLPSPFPTVGHISLQSGTGAHHDLRFVRVEEEYAPYWRLCRIVPIQDVSALFLPDTSDEGIDFEQGEWVFGCENIAKRLSSSQNGKKSTPRRAKVANSNGAVKGIIYTPEAARVLVQAEFGMAAGESAEYRPPRHALYTEYAGSVC